MKKLIVMLIAALVSVAAFAESKFATGTTSAAVNFGANVSEQYVKAIDTTSDKAGSFIKVYARDTRGAYNPSATATSTTTIISVANTGNLLTTNDLIMIEYPNKSVQYNTVSANTASQITLGTATTADLTTASRIWELQQVYQVAVGAASKSLAGDALVVIPPESPARIVVDGTATVHVAATVVP